MEGKTKMAFAKMQVPYPFKDQFLLSDEDFKVKGEKDDEEAEGNMSVSQESEGTHSLNGTTSTEELAGSQTLAATADSKKSSRATTPGYTYFIPEIRFVLNEMHVLVTMGSPGSRLKKSKSIEEATASDDSQASPNPIKGKSRSHSRKSLNKAKETDAVINSSSHSQSSSNFANATSNSLSSPHQPQNQHGKVSSGSNMSEQAARLGLYA